MMDMSNKEFTELKELVREEIENLKKFSNKEELEQLDFNTFDPTSADNCIYGQMTGDCFSPRANDLVKLCTIPYVTSMVSEPFNDVKSWKVGGFRNFSALEYYIYNYDGEFEDLKPILDYLKGEVDVLKLD